MNTIPKRFRILHYFYHKGSAAQYWFSIRIRPIGIGALLILSLGGFMSIGQPRSSVFQIFALSLSMVLLALIWATFRRASLAATFKLPRHATVDHEITYFVSLKNTGKHKLSAALIAQTDPDPRPTLREFSQTPEPGEEKRNIFDRIMAYYRWQWLLSRKQSFDVETKHTPINLDPGKTTQLSLKLTPLRRGLIPIGKIRAQLPDPFGFFQKNKIITAPPTNLIVLPKRHPLPPIHITGTTAFSSGGKKTSNTIGNSGEFIGLRDYRPGDPLRLIHWKSWAHTGRPVVKELEDTHHPRYALVLDTIPGSADEQIFEEMISTTASFILALDRENALLDLIFISGKTHTITTGQNMEHADTLLEALATVQQDPTANLHTLSQSIRSHKHTTTSTIIILNGWDTHRENFIKNLIKTGTPCTPLIISPGPTPKNIIGHHLNSQNIAQALQKLPTNLN